MIFPDSYDLLTSLTFYGGVNEIGGNKILLEDKDTRVFLDFSKGFSRRAKLSLRNISIQK
jgi:mRNA degradation ribonuclease J1/J2